MSGTASKIQFRGENSHSLEALYLVQDLAVDYSQFGIDDKTYVCNKFMSECLRLMVNRTEFLENAVCIQVFLATHKLSKNIKLKVNSLLGLIGFLLMLY